MNVVRQMFLAPFNIVRENVKDRIYRACLDVVNSLLVIVQGTNIPVILGDAVRQIVSSAYVNRHRTLVHFLPNDASGGAEKVFPKRKPLFDERGDGFKVAVALPVACETGGRSYFAAVKEETVRVKGIIIALPVFISEKQVFDNAFQKGYAQ